MGWVSGVGMMSDTQQGTNLVSNKLWPHEKPEARACTAVLLFRVRDGRSMNARNQSRLFFCTTYLVALQDSRGGKRKKDEGPGCA
jgi:hypothetical protein